MNTYNWPTQYNEHKDRHNNPYFNMLIEGGEVVPVSDDYSEDSWPNSGQGTYREGIKSVTPAY